MSDEQRLNSLNRFRKQSGRLVLEEHGHCEIPAGCGGVVLRWRNPHAALPLSLHVYSPVPAICWLDGVEVRVGRRDLAIGRHIVALAIEAAELSAGLILFAANYDPTDYQRTASPETIDRPLKVVSAADGRWRYSLAPPPPEWTSLSFDDSDWPALALASTPTLKPTDTGAYQCGRCVEVGAVCLGLPPGEQPKRENALLQMLPWRHPKQGNVWIRNVFDIAGPEESLP